MNNMSLFSFIGLFQRIVFKTSLEVCYAQELLYRLAELIYLNSHEDKYPRMKYY